MSSILQDVVIDDLFRPWPQVSVGGRSVVLEPRIAQTALLSGPSTGSRSVS